ncbi:MAG: alkane 1-monooxygenase [Ferruginibacter sp.]
MKALLYARFLSLPLLIILGFLLGGWWNFITPVVCFIIHPFLNLLRRNHFKPGPEISRDHSYTYRFIERMYVPVLIGISVWACYQSSTLSGVAFAGMAISTGLLNGILGFTIAHELIHRTNKWEKNTGYILLLNNLYMHYGIEHIWGHHVYASTVKDPHTARLGQSFYHFLPWAIVRTFLNACEIEKRKLKRQNKNWFSIFNRIHFFLLLQITVTVILQLLLGWQSVLFYILQSLVAIILLHAVNYLQHYGLARKEILPGQVERMAEHHAWNSGNRLNGLSLFQLENHAHHHLHPTHPYESLKATKSSPAYPTGYSGMIMLSLIPQLWFSIVHKRLHLTT